MCAACMPTVHVTTGPMFSGKTAEILRSLDIETVVSGGSAVLFVHASGARVKLSNGFCGAPLHSDIDRVTHAKAHIRVLRIGSVSEAAPLIRDAVAVGVDDANMFDEYDLVRLVRRIVRGDFRRVRKVFVGGLDTDMVQRPYGNGITRLLAIANTFEKSPRAVCLYCFEEREVETPAAFTVRINPLPPPHAISSLSSGVNNYRAVCRDHIHKSVVTAAELDAWIESKNIHTDKTCACFF
jgi:thymidine kinase